MFINIHTHHHALNNNQWVIQNLYKEFEKVNEVGNYSIGLHPYYINEATWEKEFSILQKFAANNFVMAIGECGLDKNCNTDFSLQQKVFSEQIILANSLQKPLVMHCVNAYQEVVTILKANKNKVPVIFHGFNKKETITLLLIEEGYYLSFGKAILKENIQNLLNKIPVDKIFFETDDDTITIEEIYSTAEKTLSVNTESLQMTIKKNAIKIFGDGLF